MHFLGAIDINNEHMLPAEQTSTADTQAWELGHGAEKTAIRDTDSPTNSDDLPSIREENRVNGSSSETECHAEIPDPYAHMPRARKVSLHDWSRRDTMTL